MKLAATLMLVVTVVAFVGYAARDTHVMRHWHPMFVEKWVNQAGYSWLGHVHTAQEPEVKDDALVRAPVTTCWDYETAERALLAPKGGSARCRHRLGSSRL